jgi:intergrase/recombinase
MQNFAAAAFEREKAEEVPRGAVSSICPAGPADRSVVGMRRVHLEASKSARSTLCRYYIAWCHKKKMQFCLYLKCKQLLIIIGGNRPIDFSNDKIKRVKIKDAFCFLYR